MSETEDDNETTLYINSSSSCTPEEQSPFQLATILRTNKQKRNYATNKHIDRSISYRYAIAEWVSK